MVDVHSNHLGGYVMANMGMVQDSTTRIGTGFRRFQIHQGNPFGACPIFDPSAPGLTPSQGSYRESDSEDVNDGDELSEAEDGWRLPQRGASAF